MKNQAKMELSVEACNNLSKSKSEPNLWQKYGLAVRRNSIRRSNSRKDKETKKNDSKGKNKVSFIKRSGSKREENAPKYKTKGYEPEKKAETISVERVEKPQIKAEVSGQEVEEDVKQDESELPSIKIENEDASSGEDMNQERFVGESEEDAEMRREALQCLRSNRRRRSELVQIPDSNIRMDLHTLYLEATGHNKINDLDSRNLERKTPWTFLRNKFGGKKMNLLESLRELLDQLGDCRQGLASPDLASYKDLHWTELVKSKFGEKALSSIPQKEHKRYEALWELFHGEVVYIIDHLLVLKEVFSIPAVMAKKLGFLEEVKPTIVFGNLDNLVEVSTRFANSLLGMFKVETLSQFGNSQAIVNAFKEFNMALHPEYHQYCVNYSAARRHLNALSNDLEFKEFIKWSEADTRCNRLHLNDLLVAPVQHLTKYPLLLKAVKSNTTKSSSEFDPLLQVISSVQRSIREIEGELHVLSNLERIQEISSNIIWPSLSETDNKAFIPEFMKSELVNQECDFLFANPWRVLIKEGYLTLIDNNKSEIYVILFDDLFLMTKHRRSSHGKSFRRKNAHLLETPTSPDGNGTKVTKRTSSLSSDQVSQGYVVFRQPLPLDRVKLYDCEEYLNSGSAYKNSFVLVQHNRFCQNLAVFTFQASGPKEKNTWVQNIRKAQRDYIELSFPTENGEDEENGVEDFSVTENNNYFTSPPSYRTSLDGVDSNSHRMFASPRLRRTRTNSLQV